MRRYLRTLVIIVILVSLGTAALAVQEIKINDFEYQKNQEVLIQQIKIIDG